MTNLSAFGRGPFSRESRHAGIANTAAESNSEKRFFRPPFPRSERNSSGTRQPEIRTASVCLLCFWFFFRGTRRVGRSVTGLTNDTFFDPCQRLLHEIKPGNASLAHALACLGANFAKLGNSSRDRTTYKSDCPYYAHHHICHDDHPRAFFASNADRFFYSGDCGTDHTLATSRTQFRCHFG